MEKYIEDFEIIKSEYEKFGPEAGEGIAAAMYESLANRISPYFLARDDVYKTRILEQLDRGEESVGSKKKFDWLDAFERNRK